MAGNPWKKTEGIQGHDEPQSTLLAQYFTRVQECSRPQQRFVLKTVLKSVSPCIDHTLTHLS